MNKIYHILFYTLTAGLPFIDNLTWRTFYDNNHKKPGLKLVYPSSSSRVGGSNLASGMFVKNLHVLHVLGGIPLKTCSLS